MLLLQLLRLLEAAGDGEAGDEHGLGVPDPAHHLTHRAITSHPPAAGLLTTDLRGVRLEGGELHALLQLDPPDGGVVLHVHCPLLNRCQLSCSLTQTGFNKHACTFLRVADKVRKVL